MPELDGSQLVVCHALDGVAAGRTAMAVVNVSPIVRVSAADGTSCPARRHPYFFQSWWYRHELV